MKVSSNYRICVVADVSKMISISCDGLSYSQACEQFVFYVRCALELGVHIRFVKIFLGNKCLKVFSNYA